MFEMYYGESGTGKSTAALEVALRAHLETGKTIRVFVGDGSAATYEATGLVDEGVIKLVDYSIFDYPMTTMQRICEGWVPEDSQDPQSKWVQLSLKELAETCAWIYEGASVGGRYVMGMTPGGLAWRAAQGEKIGQDSPISIIEPSKLKIGGNPMSHYNVAQNHMMQSMLRSKRFVSMFKAFVIWTAHERQADDQTNGGSVIGPEVAGKALTVNLSRDFNNTLHFTTATKAVRGQEGHTGKGVTQTQVQHRVYTRDHYDPDGLVQVRYKAVNRCPISKDMPDFLVADEPGQNILKFYEIFRTAQKDYLTRMAGKRAVVAA